ncbi:MAG: hypothetical protein IPK16_19825 [Anaerolineales bacterium]|nr:hypothetical protein [Anaerolineales bacterium]
MQGTDQLIGLVGPVLAGAVIAYFAAMPGDQAAANSPALPLPLCSMR